MTPKPPPGKRKAETDRLKLAVRKARTKRIKSAIRAYPNTPMIKWDGK